MIVTFFDGDDETNYLNGTAIRDNSRLFQILRSMRNRSPFICELVGENGYYLLVGVGTVGFVQYSARDGNPPYLVAVSPNSEAGESEVEFMLGGTPTPVITRYCMPFDDVLQIAGYFQETGRTYPGVAWDEI
jgi:Immunity protein Imm1